MLSGPRPARGRLRRLVTVCVGLVALAILAGLTSFFLRTEPGVERLIEVMTTCGEADAAWALAELEELDEELYRPLLDHLDSEERTSLRLLTWGYGRKARRRGSAHVGGEETWAVGQMAQFVLSTHLAVTLPPGSDVIDLKRAWSDRRAGEAPSLGRRLAWWLSGGFLLTPPSRVASRRRLVETSDVQSMLRILASRDRPEAIWAFETLKSFPDEAYDGLIDHLGDETTTRVTTIAGSGGVASRDGGYTLGRLLRHLIRVRLGHRDVLREEDPLTSATLDGLRGSWTSRRKRLRATPDGFGSGDDR